MKYLCCAFAVFLFSLSMNAQTPYQDEEPLAGKTVLVLGDSYVRNHRRPFQETWHYLFAEKHRMNYRNYGRNGGCIAFDRTREGFGPSLLVRYQEMTDTADYVIVIAGHNDAVKAGNNEDSLKMVADSLDRLCCLLIDKYPTAKIAFITPWNVDKPGFMQVIDIMKDVCGRHSIPVFDAARQSGVHVRSDKFRQRFFQSPSDTAHLNAEGHRHVLNRMEKFLLAL